MQKPYQITIRTEPVFCRNCSAVTKHELFSRKNLALNDPLLLSEKLLAVCEQCSEEQVIIASNLRSLVPAEENEFNCKVAGRGRIVVGDWVYFPGQSRPGRVKFRNRLGEREHFTMEFDDGKSFKWSQKAPNVAGKKALIAYKLLPFQIAEVKIGDYVYHVGRDMAGVAVAIAHGSENKLVIQMENRSYLLMSIPQKDLSFEKGSTLKDKIQEAFHSVLGPAYSALQLEVRGGIVYLSGTCTHMLERSALIEFIESIPGALMVLPRIKIKPTIYVPDSELETQLQTLLSNNPKNDGILGIRVFVENSEATISGYVTREGTEEPLFKQAACVNGLKEVHLNIHLQEDLNKEDIQKSQMLTEAFKNNSSLEGCNLQAHCKDGNVYLEGVVYSQYQKSTAALATAWLVKNLNIINNIKVEKRLDQFQKLHIS